MNQRVTGKIDKKYLGDPKHNSKGFPMRMDAVYLKGVRYGYFSNAPKDNPSLEAITDRYPACAEGVEVTIEYDVTENNGKTYQNIKDMEPTASSLPASDPVRKIAESNRTPDHLKPGPVPDDPLPDLNPPTRPELTRTAVAAPSGDVKDWQIARSVAVKSFNDCVAAGKEDTLLLQWMGDTEIAAAEEVCNRIARYIVEGK